jgi:hypothetical protein
MLIFFIIWQEYIIYLLLIFYCVMYFTCTYVFSVVCWCRSLLSYSGCVCSDCECFVLLVPLFKGRDRGALSSDVQFV